MGISVSRARLSSFVVALFVVAGCGGGDDGAGTASNDPGQPPGTEQPPPAAPAPGSGGVVNAKPTLSGTPPPAVVSDTAYLFQPKANDPDGDILTFSIANTPPWATFEPRTGKLSGMPGAGDIGTYPNIVISVTDGADDAALAPFTIAVNAIAGGAVELSWMPPTENTDGSPLTDLAGYKIYWGTIPGEYSNSVTIDNPGVATYVLENLVPATYYFIATAFNVEGVESEPSEEATGTVS